MSATDQRMGDIRGEASTFATLHVWDEADFRYRRVMDCVRFEDARAEYLALHQPPMVIVVSVRWGREVSKPCAPGPS